MIRSIPYIFLILSFCINVNAQENSRIDTYHNQLFSYLDEVNSGYYDGIIKVFNTELFLEHVFEDIPNSSLEIQTFRKDFSEGLKSKMKTSLTNIFEAFDYFEYINYSEYDSEFTLRIRGTSEESGINYLDLRIDTSRKDSLYITDFYSFFSGEYFSTTINRNIKLIIAENSALNNILELLNVKEKQLTENFPKLMQMIKYSDMGAYEDVRKVYENLPESVKKEKIFFNNMINVAQNLDDKYYSNLLKIYEEEYPNDPSIPLVTLDYYLLRGELDTAHKMVDKLDEIVGGDNYLNTIRASIEITRSDYSAARNYLELAVENNIYLEEAYWSLLELDLVEEKFDSVNKLLTKLEEYFGYEFTQEGFESVELYSKYLESDEYLDWKNSTEN